MIFAILSLSIAAVEKLDLINLTQSAATTHNNSQVINLTYN